MRAPIPFVAPPMPVVASPVIRDDVALDAIAPATWDALAGSQPFLTHAFLTALHTTGCAVPRTGWKPRYLTAWREHALIGALPLYAKAHSYGEYVFDWGWAEAYRRHGRRYYPKLLAAIPFTPVPGPRLLSPDAGVRRALLEYALDAVRRGMYFLAARAVSARRRSGRRTSAGHDPAPGRPVSLDQRGLSRFHRFPGRLFARQAQESETGAAQARLRRRHVRAQARPRRSPAPTGRFSISATKRPIARIIRRPI